MREGGAALLSSNNEAVVGGQHNRFETSIEDFYATLDQIELNLKCAAETTGQSQTSGRWDVCLHILIKYFINNIILGS